MADNGGLALLNVRPCPECERLHGDAYYEGGVYHWHCAQCGEITGYQGHYGLRASGWGFSCDEIRTPEEAA